MADQGIWFKLWVSSLDDPDLDNLTLEQFARWCKLGAYLKKHGTAGSLSISPPSSALCSMLKCVTVDDVIQCISMLPNVTVTSVTSPSVSHTITINNWLKYQGDNSYHRVKKFRAKKRQSVTPKKRREENKEKEEKEKTLFLRFVRLTDEENQKLKERLNGSYQAMLERLDGYIGQIGAQKAAKYKSHYDTILNWWRKDHPDKSEGVWDGISAPRN